MKNSLPDGFRRFQVLGLASTRVILFSIVKKCLYHLVSNAKDLCTEKLMKKQTEMEKLKGHMS